MPPIEDELFPDTLHDGTAIYAAYIDPQNHPNVGYMAYMECLGLVWKGKQNILGPYTRLLGTFSRGPLPSCAISWGLPVRLYFSRIQQGHVLRPSGSSQMFPKSNQHLNTACSLGLAIYAAPCIPKFHHLNVGKHGMHAVSGPSKLKHQ